ncbi:hypothetical protein [Lysobacter silvisoli]|uniref:DUF1795 domain-containing protein n=1 Tax=Lysobacter silvisoli TaxID=2293254 RepID=A0A371K6F9_9GAMM|nr:hypothetical protein [Lysobacter silvisoli]RDZ29541.1 hypothetical protein DX914_10835 [Lysobacter silvisoli]
MHARSLSLLLLALAAAPLHAETVATPAIAAPDVAHAKKYAQDGISLSLPGNWKVIENTAMEQGGGRALGIEADKPDFETLGLDITVQVYPDDIAPSLQGAAEFLVQQQTEGSDSYTEAKHADYKLGGRFPALVARYTHTAFGADSAYAKRVDLYAIKACGAGWTCLLYTQTVAANESAASAGMAQLYDTVKFAPAKK